jgi:hypothetical protein
MRERIDQQIEPIIATMMYSAGEILHDLHDECQTEDEVRALVQWQPMLLTLPVFLLDGSEHWSEDDGDLRDEIVRDDEILPIQQAMIDYNVNNEKNINAIAFIPVRAEEGAKHNVGGDGMRGGLLCKDIAGTPRRDEDEYEDEFDTFCRLNVLEHLVRPLNSYESNKDEDYDSLCLGVIKKLQDMDLFKKVDIKKYQLLPATFERSESFRKMTFEYLVDLDPDILKDQSSWYDGHRTLLHRAACRTTTFHSEYHHYEFDRLNEGGEARYENPMVFKVVLKAGLKHYPHESGFLFHKDYEEDSAVKEDYKRYGKGGTWNTIQACLDKMDSKVLERNPCTNLYPFMVAAAKGCVGCLDVAHYILRKNPMVLK